MNDDTTNSAVGLAIKTFKTSFLKEYESNPRKNDHAVDKVAEAIKEFGFRVPIVAKSDGTVVDGHLRLKAARKLGLAEVPVILADDLTELQIKAFRISVNKVADLAEWDTGLLADELKALGEAGFDLELTGFDDVELVTFLAGKTDGLTDPDDVPEAPVNPVTVLGDVWVMGKHRVMCGDSTDTATVAKVLGGQLADLVFTDPPYGVSFQSGMSKGGTATRFDKIANDDRILDIVPIIASALRNDGAMFIWTSHQVYPAWREQFSEFYKHTIIWHKPGGGIGDLKGNYATDYEFCLFGVKGSVRFRGKRGMAVWTIAKDGVTSYPSPTQKPVALAVRAIEDFSDAGDSVLDLFGGSGSTLIACEQTGRSARIIELDTAYCDVIIERWQRFTGKEAALEHDERTFNEISANRKIAA